MPKKYRLTGEELKHLAGKRIHGAYFSLLVAPISGSSPKCACVASKKVSTRAVDRNTVKRRCRNALAKRIAQFDLPFALVFHAKKEARKATYGELSDDIESLLKRARP